MQILCAELDSARRAKLNPTQCARLKRPKRTCARVQLFACLALAPRSRDSIHPLALAAAAASDWQIE